MGALLWFRRASEYAVGAALVLVAHLALGRRGLRLMETFDDEDRDPTRWN